MDEVTRESPVLTRLLRATLAATILCLGLAPVVRAQVDPQAQIIKLETRVQLLEARLQKQEIDTALLRAEMQKAFAKNAAELVGLRTDDFVKLNEIGRLQADVEGLKGRQPADPGKTPPAPPGSNPPKPADGQVLSLRAPFSVKDASGREIFRVDVRGSQPRAFVGNASGARVELGMSVDGTPAVGLYDASNTALSALVGDPKGSYMFVKDKEQSAVLGKYEGKGTGLFLRRGEKSTGELSSDSKGYGALRVYGADGKAVGGMFAGADGGGLALAAAGGGKSVISLAVTPSGGKVRVFAAGGGTTRAELIADGATGAVNIFDSDGGTAVNITSLQSKAGKLEISNGSGNIVVQAGAQKNGRGMVTTGPVEGGLAGAMGGGLTPASTIVGRMKGK